MREKYRILKEHLNFRENIKPEMKIVDMFTYICRVCINICICTQFYVYKYLSHHHNQEFLSLSSQHLMQLKKMKNLYHGLERRMESVAFLDSR